MYAGGSINVTLQLTFLALKGPSKVTKDKVELKHTFDPVV
jgi:hypothetical protein